MSGAGPSEWDRAARRALARPYLDPAMVAVKRAEHLALLDRWLPERTGRRVLKTDLWEEGVAGDELLFTLARQGAEAVGMDVSPRVVAEARTRAGVACELHAGDVRRIPEADGAVDAIISTSTLDHFDDPADIDVALAELRRVLAPGGTVIVSLDNPENVGHRLLSAAGRAGFVPFALGVTFDVAALEAALRRAGLTPIERAWLVPAPRLVATLAVRALRLLGPRRSEPLVQRLLGLFAAAGRRWPRRLACFVAVRAHG